MTLPKFLKPKKSIAELEEEREHNEMELSVLQQNVLKKELEARGASISQFKDAKGNTMWDRIKNWLKN
jgi:hypothetical protein